MTGVPAASAPLPSGMRPWPPAHCRPGRRSRSMVIGSATEAEGRMANDEPITRMLSEWRAGSPDALERLTPLVYAELKRLAERSFRGEPAAHTLQPTALVNEAFEALVRMDVPWQDRSHFYALSARLMRRILINHAHARRAAKRGGDVLKVTFTDQAAEDPADESVLALDAAMTELAGFDPRKAEVVELHYFGGLNYDEIAEALGLSRTTVSQDLRTARAWLRHRLDTIDEGG